MSATQLSNSRRQSSGEITVPGLVITGFVLSVKAGDIPKNTVADGPVTWLSETCFEAIL